MHTGHLDDRNLFSYVFVLQSRRNSWLYRVRKHWKDSLTVEEVNGAFCYINEADWTIPKGAGYRRTQN